MDDLIAKVLAGEAGREEVDILEGWMDELPENRIYFEETKKLFASIDSFKMNDTVDVDAAWNKVNERISQDAKIIPLFKRPVILRAAASLLVIAFLAILVNYVFDNNTPVPIVLASTNKTVEQKLPDGSKVFMNKNSEIAYVLNKDHKREVKLKGEAYFEVVHNEKEPFVVNVEGVIIEDIGTAFNVKAITGSNKVEVIVESGEVRFYTESNKGISLVKGEKAVYYLSTKEFVKSIPNPVENTTSYRSKVFTFKGTSLHEVVAQVNEVYGSDIRLADDKLGSRRLSVLFNNEDVDVIVTIISETLDLEVEHTGNTIILKDTVSAGEK